MSGTTTMKCSCKSDYQDEHYGKGVRVYNVAGKDKDKRRCTVCGYTTEAPRYASEAKPKKK